MAPEIAIKEMSTSSVGSDMPMMTLQELDADTHGTFRRYRGDHAVVRHEAGSYFVLRMASIGRSSPPAAS